MLHLVHDKVQTMSAPALAVLTIFAVTGLTADMVVGRTPHTNKDLHSDPYTDPHSDPPIDPHSDPHIDPHSDPPIDPHSDPHIDPHSDPPIDPHSDPHSDLNSDLQNDPHSEPHIPPSDPHSDPHSDPLSNPHSAKRKQYSGGPNQDLDGLPSSDQQSSASGLLSRSPQPHISIHPPSPSPSPSPSATPTPTLSPSLRHPSQVTTPHTDPSDPPRSVLLRDTREKNSSTGVVTNPPRASMSTPLGMGATPHTVLPANTPGYPPEGTITMATSDSPPPGSHSDTNSSSAHQDTYSPISHEKLLLRILMDNYSRVGRRGRPVFNISTSVQVYFHLALIQMDLDERSKILTTSVWAKHVWRDEYLRWDPALYGGLSVVKLEVHDIWMPDITLYNAADVTPDQSAALAVVQYNGVVNWYPHTTMRSSCSVDVSNFPFDSQECHMWFGSWTYPVAELNLTEFNPGQALDLRTFQSDYKESCAWDIVEVETRRELKGPSNASDRVQFSVLTFNLVMRRKVVFSTYILTLPCIFLALLTLVVFWLPPERPDRTGLAMSTFSSFMVLLLILVESAPPTASSIPTLGVYYCFNMVIITLSIVLSSLVVNVSRGDTQRMPHWLATVCCLRSRPPIADSSQPEERQGMLPPGAPALGPDPLLAPALHDAPPPGDRGHGRLLRGCDQHLRDIAAALGRVERRLCERRSRAAGGGDWQHAALVMDRLFFVVYLMLITVSLSVLFPKPIGWMV